MFRFSKAATLMMRYMAPAGDDGAASGAQDIESRIQAALFHEQQPDDGNADDQDDAVVNGDGKRPPEADDADAGEDAELDGDDADDGEITVASLLGIDEDKLEYDAEGKVVFNAIIDGQVQKVPMGELVKSYQLQGHVNNKSIALENDRKEFHATRDQAYGELTARLQGLNQLIQLNEQTLLAEYNGIDWDSLRMTEPGEWAALQQQFNQRALQIQQVKDLAGQESQRLTQEQQQQQLKAS